MTGRPHTPRTAAAISTCAVLLALSACGGGGSGTKTSAPLASANSSSSVSTAPLSPADPAALERVVPEPATIAAAAGTFTLTSATGIHASSGAEPVAADLAAYLKQQTGLAPQTSQST